jgi:hypothetical protein
MIKPVLTGFTLAEAAYWIGQSAPLPDVLFWHLNLCPVCAGWPVICGEYDEIITDYQITAILMTGSL